MRRILFYSFILLFLSGCVGQTTEVDLKALSAELLESGSFSEQLELLEEDRYAQIYQVYGLDEADTKNGVLYLSTGATAEEIALFEATDETAAERISDALNAWLSDQIALYATYNPGEAEKLEKANLLISGRYVFFCVAADSSLANETIKKHTEQ